MMRSLDEVAAHAATEADGFECDLEGIHHRLNLWGRFRPSWLGDFCLHLFAAGLEVVEADATKTRAGPWASSFLLASTTRQPLGHDFLLMARHAPRGVPPLPTPVISISVRLSHESPGHVYANVAGKDSSGLIAHVLEHFARFGLRPRRCIIRTRGGEIDDWFWLAPITEPSSMVLSEGALERDWRRGATP